MTQVSLRALDQENPFFTNRYGITWGLLRLECHAVWGHHFTNIA
jgi:hypothetical protein